MTASTDPILFLDKTCPRFFIFMQQIKGIRPKPALRIRSTSCKISINLILRNEHRMFFPRKPVSCLIRDDLIRKLLKLL